MSKDVTEKESFPLEVRENSKVPRQGKNHSGGIGSSFEIWKICSPFRLAGMSMFLAAFVGVVATISRYNYGRTTAKSPWIICCYTPREHRRCKPEEGKSTRDCRTYISRIITCTLPLLIPLHAWLMHPAYVRTLELPLINAGEC